MKHYLNSYVLSEKRMAILTFLYVYRGGTAKQILCWLNPEKFPFDYVHDMKPSDFNKLTGLKNLQKYLLDLKQQGLIQSEFFSGPTGNSQFYSLTKEGLHYIKGHLYIEFEYHGSGFGEDYGDFTYELNRPPQKRNIYHHLLTVDFFINVKQYVERNSIVPGTIQYRDNRYCSVEYQVKSKMYKHRPDAELMIENKLYWVEIDRGTENSTTIVNKFDNYARYLKYLTENGHPLPEGIVFLTDIKKDQVGKDRRWKTLSKSFHENLGNYAPNINLMYGDLSEIQKILTQELVAEAMIEKRLKSYVKYYLADQPFIELNESHGLKSGNALCSITKHDSHDQLFIYERVNCLETKGIAKLAAFIDYLQKEKQLPESIKRVREVIPVFYQHVNEVKPLLLDMDPVSWPKKTFIHVQDPIWINVYGESPIWLYSDGTKISSSNPLRSMKPEISFSKSLS